MPIYEYRCDNCRRRTSVFLRTFAKSPDPVCSACGSSDLSRLISTFAVVKSEESRSEDLADPSRFSDVDENDPRSVARWARRMGGEFGEEMGPEFDEMVDRLEAGESPEAVFGEGGGDMAGDGPEDDFDLD